MTRRHFAMRSCSTKTRYRDHTQAIRSSHNYNRARDAQLRAYECDFCKGWHLTKQLVKERP